MERFSIVEAFAHHLLFCVLSQFLYVCRPDLFSNQSEFDDKVLPKEKREPGGRENDENEEELLKGETGDVQIVIEEEKTDDIGDERSKYTHNEIDVQSIYL